MKKVIKAVTVLSLVSLGFMAHAKSSASLDLISKCTQHAFDKQAYAQAIQQGQSVEESFKAATSTLKFSQMKYAMVIQQLLTSEEAYKAAMEPVYADNSKTCLELRGILENSSISL